MTDAEQKNIFHLDPGLGLIIGSILDLELDARLQNSRDKAESEVNRHRRDDKQYHTRELLYCSIRPGQRLTSTFVDTGRS